MKNILKIIVNWFDRKCWKMFSHRMLVGFILYGHFNLDFSHFRMWFAVYGTIQTLSWISSVDPVWQMSVTISAGFNTLMLLSLAGHVLLLACVPNYICLALLFCLVVNFPHTIILGFAYCKSFTIMLHADLLRSLCCALNSICNLFLPDYNTCLPPFCRHIMYHSVYELNNLLETSNFKHICDSLLQCVFNRKS